MTSTTLPRAAAIAATALAAAMALNDVHAATATFPVGTSCSLDVIPACEPAQDFEFTTDGALTAEVTVVSTCLASVVRLFVDAVPVFTSSPVDPGESTGIIDLGPVSPGTHTLTVAADVPLSVECDSRFWSGTLAVTVSGVSDDDVVFVEPGDVATVSTAVFGSPRPAGITATLTRSPTATTIARLSVATYDGLPFGVPTSPPIRAAGFLDLQLTNADDGDAIAGEFLPPSPILPPNPVLPPNPIVPPNPILPPSPIRLAHWDGAAWAPVFGSTSLGNPLPSYDSVANVFTVTFDLTSSPAVTALGGTVFAVVPNYYFRGFGIPVDAATPNVAKAGRAIPLKWQLFDLTATPVLDLDPSVVGISSVAIPCDASADATDALEEYAAGASGLQNLGDGSYQLNWGTQKSYAGTCRRVRLDLGERNADGTTFYRTADFHFTR